MKGLSISALLFGLIVAAVALAGALFAWWRWERIAIVEGDVALPPGTEIVRISEPENPGEAKVYIAHNKRPATSLRDFFKDELEQRGWEEEGASDNVTKYSNGGRSLRIVFHGEKGGTKFTLSLKPGK